jgi:hypothetical protein
MCEKTQHVPAVEDFHQLFASNVWPFGGTEHTGKDVELLASTPSLTRFSRLVSSSPSLLPAMDVPREKGLCSRGGDVGFESEDAGAASVAGAPNIHRYAFLPATLMSLRNCRSCKSRRPKDKTNTLRLKAFVEFRVVPQATFSTATQGCSWAYLTIGF